MAYPLRSSLPTSLGRFIRGLTSLVGSVAIALSIASESPAQGYAPAEAAERMKVAEGLRVRLIASEPLVRQPVCIEWDDRGRLWVIQYLQYPNPAGLQRVQVDRYSRTEYDQVPKPPPHGPRGSDRITILSDEDGDGVMDSGRDFIDGLNLASGMAFGHGGVYVLNAPYLLFYPDRDRNDLPDSDPQVLLSGFGMQDAHSVANSLAFGPDGWLYGCQGSTVTARISGIEFQQGVWRYHPITGQFELFCEGGGNAWGLDWDADGHLMYSTNYGGYVLVHGVQGGNYVKSFAKHGPLHNPFTYGYFEHAPHREFRGGHVTVGGIVYRGGALPKRFHNKYLAGDLLGHAAWYHSIVPIGSTFRTETDGQLLDSRDTWFAPTDLTCAPDGSVTIADWHDQRTAHPDPDAQWDRSNGRIYSLEPDNAVARSSIDLASLSNDQLLEAHLDSNQWMVRRSRCELARRQANELCDRLAQRVLHASQAETAREYLWTYLTLQSPGAEGSQHFLQHASALLESPHAVVRYWTIRQLGQCGRLPDLLAHQMDSLVEREQDACVRSQLASTAGRLPADQALPIINANINRDIDSRDPFLPLQWWWAVESHAISGSDQVMRRFTRPTLWRSKLGSEILLPRLLRRYMAEGTQQSWKCCLQLLQAVPDRRALTGLWPAVLAGWKDSQAGPPRERAAELPSHELATFLNEHWHKDSRDAALDRLAVLLGNRRPIDEALARCSQATSSTGERLDDLLLIGEFAEESMAAQVLALYQSEGESADVRKAALRVLARLSGANVGQAILDHWRASPGGPMAVDELDVLFSRHQWALNWLHALSEHAHLTAMVSIEQVRRLSLLKDEQVDELVRRYWGRVSGASAEYKLAEVRRLNNDLRSAEGEVAAGQSVFKKHCAVCHRLHGAGGGVGPDLTSANRSDRDFLLVSLVDPSAVIRKEYASVIVRTTDDRILSGMAAPGDQGGLKLITAKNESIELPSNEVSEVRVSEASLMPDDLYKQLSPQELRDLFAYLRS